jgi:hypothetical protein
VCVCDYFGVVYFVNLDNAVGGFIVCVIGAARAGGGGGDVRASAQRRATDNINKQRTSAVGERMCVGSHSALIR